MFKFQFLFKNFRYKSDYKYILLKEQNITLIDSRIYFEIL
jgi:hypothetical protein